MRLGVIGSGRIVREYLPVLQKMDDIEVLSLMNRPDSKTLKAVQEEFQVPHAVHTIKELVDLGCDTAYVAVPNSLHADVAKDALAHGLHVIVEKPFTVKSNDAQELAALAREKSLFLFEAITTLHFEGLKWVRERLDQIGRLRLIALNYSQYSSRYDAFKEGKIAPAFDPKLGGGALMDLNVYNVHFILALFGQPKEVHYFPNLDRGVDTSGVLHLSYPDFEATAMAAKDADAPKYFILEGTDGTISLSDSPGRMGTITLETRDGKRESFTEVGEDRRMEIEFRAFQRMMASDAREEADRLLNHSLAVVQLLEDARRAAGLIE